jgi:hypothetical protein
VHSRRTPQLFRSTPAPTGSHTPTYLHHSISSHKRASDSDASLGSCPFHGLGRFYSPAQSEQQGRTRTSVLWYAELANASVSRSLGSQYGLIGGRASVHIPARCHSLYELKLNLRGLHSMAFNSNSSSNANTIDGLGVYLKLTSLSVVLA